MTLTAVDLFSGAGGLSIGLEAAGFDVLGAFDSWHEAVMTYRRNFDHPAFEMDLGVASASDLLRQLDRSAGEVDLVVGGPPCQGFSIQRIGSDSDSRNDLVGKFGQIIVGIRPRAFLMENVPGLLGRRGAATLDHFRSAVAEAGYEYTVHRVDAVEYGVAQRRPRVMIYGWRADEQEPSFELHGLAHRPVSVAEAFTGLPQPATNGALNAADALHVESRLSDLNRERLGHIPQGGGFEDLPVHLRVNAHRNGAAQIGHRAVYGRLAYDEPANVITARFDSFTRGRFAHPNEDRNITLREGARLQSFPDDFQFEGNREQIAAQIGNAVPPLMAAEVAKRIARHLACDSSQLADAYAL